MKKIAIFFVVFIFLLTLCGCYEEEFVNSGEGDLSLSLHQYETESKEETDLTKEELLFVGKWDLISAVVDGKEVVRKGDYFRFKKGGRAEFTIDGEYGELDYDFANGRIVLDSYVMDYTVKEDTITMVTKSGTKYVIKRKQEKTEEKGETSN